MTNRRINVFMSIILMWIFANATNQSVESVEQTYYTMYLPYFTKPYSRSGIAWCSGCGGKHSSDLQLYQAPLWYANNSNPSVVVGDDTRLPIIRSSHTITDVVNLQENGYHGPVLWLNEPDLAGQDDLAAVDGAVIWHQIQSACPDCLWVVGNVSQINGLQWLQDFTTAYRLLYGQDVEPWAWGFHLYLWPGGDSLDDMIYGICQIVANCNRLWLTEWGTCYQDIALDFFRKVRDNHKISTHFYFTNRNSVPWGSCSELIDENGNETYYGQLYRQVFIIEAPLS